MAFTPLHALRSFIAVARRRSFAAAARDLGVSTSALSQSVRQLEKRIGATLLVRTSRSVALTEAGQRLLDHSGAAVDQALESLRVASATRGEVSGRLRLTVPTVAVALVLSRLVPRFIERHPRVELDVHVDNRMRDSVGAGFDAGIRLIQAIDRDMVRVRLSGPCRIVVAAAPSYLVRRGTPLKPQDLIHHDCITFRIGPSDAPWAWQLQRGKRTWRVPVRGPLMTNDPHLSMSAALAGTGLIYRLEPSIQNELASGELQVVLAGYSPPVPGLFLFFPSRAQTSPALRAFVSLAREQARADDRAHAETIDAAAVS